MLTQGVVFSNRYRLGERVATGGMGAVWRCVDTLLDREVAVKVLPGCGPVLRPSASGRG